MKGVLIMQSIFVRRPHMVPCVVVAVMLVIALGDHHRDYYTFLRYVVCVTGAFTAWRAYVWDRPWAIWLMGGLALLFNPFVPIQLNREIWKVVDIFAAAVFLHAAFYLPAKIVRPKPETIKNLRRFCFLALLLVILAVISFTITYEGFSPGGLKKLVSSVQGKKHVAPYQYRHRRRPRRQRRQRRERREYQQTTKGIRL